MINEKKRSENPAIGDSQEDWIKHWQPTDYVSSPSQAIKDNPVCYKGDFTQPVRNCYPGALGFNHQPFTLTWNGQHYVPDFVPTDIRVTAYGHADYMEVKQAYNEAKKEAVLVPVLSKQVTRLQEQAFNACDIIDELHEKLDAYKHLWSAREYLDKLDIKETNVEARIILNNALYDIRDTEFDWKAVRNKYASIDSSGRKIVAPHESSLEERSI